jgi:hypothetical protein
MRALAHIIIKKNPGAMRLAAGAETFGAWVNAHVLQHLSGGK